MRALIASLMILMALPGAASAASVSVEPFVESPEVDPFGSCSRYMTCPPDMIVFTAAPGEPNALTITEQSAGFQRIRFLVHDEGNPVQAGAGCEQIDANTAACTAGATGPIQLGDGADRIESRRGDVSGGDGDDLLHVLFGYMDGNAGADVLVGTQATGGGGDDLLTVGSGEGGAGDDILRCFPLQASCHFDGGPGDDVLRGGTSPDLLLGGAGDDLLQALAGDDRLRGGRGGDRLVGGAGGDRLQCGGGRDQALADRRDRITRCERVRRPT